MKKTIVLLPLLLAFTALFSQPRNIQAKVIEASHEAKNRVVGKAVSMQGDTVYFRIGFRGIGRARSVTPGTWLTIYADWRDKECVWTCRKIKVNN